MTITTDFIRETLGPQRYVHEQRLTTSAPGVVTGLAYTPTGGEILHIEATRYPGKGNITLTGQIGEVMKESAQAALSLVRSRGMAIGVKPEEFRDIRHSCARPRRRRAEGWALSRSGDVYRAGIPVQQQASSLRCRHDR